MLRQFDDQEEKEQRRDWIFWLLLGAILVAYLALGSLMVLMHNIRP